MLFAIVSLLPAGAAAQTGAGSLTGIVTDQSGAAVPGATVTATNQATNVDYTAISNNAGNYTVTSLPVGTYVVKAELSRFKTAATQPIQVEAHADRPARLQAGARRASRKRSRSSATSPVLQTETATVGEVISGTTLESLPLNGRNTGQLSLLLPGVVTPNPSTFTRRSATSAADRPYVNGNREQTNNYTIDGVDMNESIDNLVAYQPSPDALAEISVETNNYAADTGNVAGAVISNVIKSGLEPVPRQRLRVLPQQRHGRELLGEQPLGRGQAGAPAGHLRRHARRAARQEQAVLLRRTIRGRGTTRPGSRRVSVAPEAWRRGDLSSVSRVDPRSR